MKSDLAALKIELRKLYDRYPQELERVVQQVERMAIARATLPPDPNNEFLEDTTAARLDWVLPPIKIVRGKPAKLDDISLALLLIDYRCREGSREDFIDQAKTRLFGNGYSLGRINIEEHLKAAEQKEKRDADFKALVADLSAMGERLQRALKEVQALEPP